MQTAPLISPPTEPADSSSTTLVHSTAHPVCKPLQLKPRRTPVPILFLVDQLTELGGGERVLLELARRLPPREFSTSVISFRDQPNPAAFDLCGHVEFMPLQAAVGLEAMKVAWRLRALIQERDVKIVHTFFETSDLYGTLVAKLARVRHVVSSRRDMGILRTPKHRLAYRLLGPVYSRVVTVSEQVREQNIQADHLRRDRVETIYNGIEADRFLAPPRGPAARQQLDIPETALLVTTIANINVWKGLDVFLRCASEVTHRRDNVYFAIAGDFTDAKLTEELRLLADSLGVRERVRFLGRVPDVRTLLSASDVFCLLSRTEGFPNAVLEAMACALPVVATRVGGTPEAVDEGRTGMLVESEDHRAAASKVLALLQNPTVRDAMGRAARQRVLREFTVQTMVSKHVDLYNSLLERS